jgi:hypothetical protein
VPTDLDQLINRFDRLDSKFEELRRELMASFVLKQVFDIAMEARDKEMEELKAELHRFKEHQMGALQRWVAIGGGLLGIISSAIYLLHTYLK